MALPSAIKLFIDPKLGLAFGNFAGTSQISKPTFTLGDTAGVEIYLVENTQVSNYPRQEIPFPATPGIKVAIGSIDEAPRAGTWTITFGGNTTSALAYNATATQVETALNVLASITSAGGVTVSKIGDNYNIVFNVVGARALVTTDSSALIPLSTATVAALQEGSANQAAITLLHLQRTVAGLATSFTQTEASAIQMDTLGAWDGSKATTRVSISPDPKGGSFTLSFDALVGDDVSTSSIQVGASAQDVQNALNIKALTDKVTVTQVGAYAYDITVATQPGGSGLTANYAGLLSYNGYYGELSLNTVEAISLLDGAESVETTLEVEITSDSKTLTLLQVECTLKNAVIDVGAIQPLVLDTYLSENAADGIYLQQTNNLSDLVSNTTARTNLGVYSTGQVDTALALKANLSGADFTGEITAPTIGNVLNTDLVIDSYNDTGAGTHYFHKFTPGDGKLVLATNGGGLTFPDGTTQTTAATPFDPTGYATESFVTSQGYLTSVPAPTLTNLTSDISWDLYANAGQLLIAGVKLDANLDTQARVNFSSGVPTLPAVGDFWFNGTDFFYQSGGTKTFASQTYVNAQGFITSNALSSYAQLAGATFTGKINAAAPTAGSASLNLGVGTTPTTSVAGDIWIASNINYKDSVGTQKAVANTNTSNTYTAPQIIQTTVGTVNTALRITQQGTGAALVVEDSATPDTSAFVVNANGDVGIAVAAGYTPNSKLTIFGNTYLNGNLLCNDITSGTVALLGSVTLSSLTFATQPGITITQIATQANPTTSGTIHYADYPQEVLFKINGVNYAMPARIV